MTKQHDIFYLLDLMDEQIRELASITRDIRTTIEVDEKKTDQLVLMVQKLEKNNGGIS